MNTDAQIQKMRDAHVSYVIQFRVDLFNLLCTFPGESEISDSSFIYIIGCFKNELGFTYKELEHQLGVDPGKLERWVRGRWMPSQSTRFFIVGSMVGIMMKQYGMSSSNRLTEPHN